MEDQVARYLVQLATITAGAMSLAEWLTIKRVPFTKLEVGTAGSTRKRYSALVYSLALNSLGVVAKLVILPGETWWQQGAGLVLLSLLSVAGGHLVHAGGSAVAKRVGGGSK